MLAKSASVNQTRANDLFFSFLFLFFLPTELVSGDGLDGFLLRAQSNVEVIRKKFTKGDDSTYLKCDVTVIHLLGLV